MIGHWLIVLPIKGIPITLLLTELLSSKKKKVYLNFGVYLVPKHCVKYLNDERRLEKSIFSLLSVNTADLGLFFKDKLFEYVQPYYINNLLKIFMSMMRKNITVK